MDVSILSYEDKLELLKILEDKIYYDSGRKFFGWFKDNRDGYDRHMLFLKDGANYRQRAFLAGNRVGKSETGAFEVACHATGIYPDWWEGKRFYEPTHGWVCGKTSEVVRDTIQVALLGPAGEWGTGMLPRLEILHVNKSAGQRADVVTVKHASGGISTIGFKSNDAGRQSFEGTARHYIWLDEETDREIYFECVARTMTTDGVVFTTFTPLKGLTDLVLSLVQDGNLDTPVDGVSVTTCGWEHAPHLSLKVREEMLALLPPHQRLARSQGIPQLGSGAIYPIDIDSITMQSFEIPKHWKRLSALDVGWKRTAACWLAVNPDDDNVYVYSEHYVGEALPVSHTESIKARNPKGAIIPTVIDSAAHGRSQIDGQNLFDLYKNLGLDLHNANKAVESGIYEVWSLFNSGKLKITSNCTHLLSELKTYRRDDKGKIVKSNDHLMDCLRYAVMGLDRAVVPAPASIYDPSKFYAVNTMSRTTM